VRKILVIGCGSIGQRHIKALLSIGENNIAAYRTEKGQLVSLDDEIKNNVEVFKNEDVAFAWEPSHIIISNPTNLHLKYLVKSIQLGTKVFVEKPITNNYDELENASIPLSKIKEYDGIIGFNLRFNSLINKIRSIITSQVYGKAISANLMVGYYLPFWHPDEDYRKSYAARLDLGGGVLRTLCHEIDLAQYFFRKINKVFAKVEKLSSLETDVDDFVDIIMETENCKHVLIHLDYLNPVLLREGRILFDRGLLDYNLNNKEIYFTDYVNKQKELIFKGNENYDDQYILQMNHFIKGKSEIACKIKEGIEVMKVIKCCEESGKEGREIYL